MRSVGTAALLTAVLLPLGVTRAAAPRPLEVRASLAGSSHGWRWRELTLRPLSTVPGHPGPYALLEKWVDAVARPPADGTPRIVVVPVPSGLALAWAHRW